ncbi:MAG: tetratricopeptide repeat protein [Acidobacteriota bacterium]|jgi:tetratricopeptide (TPR) repeat protein
MTRAGDKRQAGAFERPGKLAEPARKPIAAVWICFVLLITIFAVYSQVRTFDFVNYDDPDYVTDNPHVRNGLTADGAAWAFTTTFAANWFPITWLSHMLDVQFFGLQSGWHHLINVLIHALSTVLLFALLKRMTGALWSSAFVAFVFGLHPLHVESVAWIAERKDALCGLFWLLTLWAYVKYIDRPGTFRYASMLLMFCCGLMSKPMIITLPLVALLLDVWPLRRFQARALRAILEKLPLLSLAVAVSFVAYLVQKHGGAISSLDELPLTLRLQNALISYLAYIAKFFWPTNLAMFYPYPAELTMWKAVAAGLALAGITAVVLFSISRRPYLAVGWLWYLITLAPVIGIVQIGLQSRADRYTYVPMIGISIMLAWGLPDALQRLAYQEHVVGALAAIACSGWLIVTWFDIQHWRNSISLSQHALQVTNGNYIAYNNLGVALRRQGGISSAIANFQEALKIKPRNGDAENNLGEALLAQGKVDEATAHILEALRLQPNSPEAHINLGAALCKRGRFEDAETQYRLALRYQPASAEAHCGLGVALIEKGQFQKALPELWQAVSIKPEYADAHYNLGRVLGLIGRTDEAKAQFSETIRLDPGNAEAHYNLGTALAAQGHLTESLDEFQAAIRIRPSYLNARFNLGSALASLGRYDEAITQFSEVLRHRPDWPELRQNLDACLNLRAKSKREQR